MQLSAIRTYIKGRYTTDLSDTELDEHINELYRDLARLFTADTVAEDATASTVESTATYTVGANTRKIKAVYFDTGSNRRRLMRIHQDSIVYPRSNGTPQRWYPYGMTDSTGDVRQQVGIDPPPNASNESKTLTVVYEPEPVTLSAASDTPKYVPEEHQHLIGYGVIAICAAHRSDYATAQQYEDRYLRGYAELARKMGSEAESNFPEIAKRTEG